MTPEEKAVVQEAIDKMEEVMMYIMASLPLKSAGAGYIHNELGPVQAKLMELID